MQSSLLSRRIPCSLSFVNTESTGIYAIGQSIAYSIFQVMTSLDKVFVPEIYKMMFIKKYKEIGNYLSPFFFFLSLLTLGIISSANIIVDIFLECCVVLDYK